MYPQLVGQKIAFVLVDESTMVSNAFIPWSEEKIAQKQAQTCALYSGLPIAKHLLSLLVTKTLERAFLERANMIVISLHFPGIKVK